MPTDILDRRLSLAPHYSAHPQDAERILLLSEERSLRLRGQFYRDLLPRLDGSMTGRQILKALRPALPEGELEAVLHRLLEQGHVVALPDRYASNLAAYWAAQGKSPLETDRHLKSTTLGVLGLGEEPAASLEGAAALVSLLAGSGLKVTDDSRADLLLVLVDDYLQPALAEFAGEAAARGRSWIPFKPAGLSAWLGPRIGEGVPASAHPATLEDPRRPCFHCLARRLITHRPGDTLIAAPRRGLRPARGWSAGSLALARGLAVAETLHQLQGAPSRLDRNLLTIDTLTGEARSHLAPRFQDCPHCGQKASSEAIRVEPAPIRLSRVATGGDGDGGWRALSAEQALARLEPIVSPLTGIVSHLRDHELAQGLYLSMASQANREQVDPRENRRLGKPGSAGGKGLTRTQAKVSCLAEAVERYACGWTGTEPRRQARYLDLRDSAVHPASVLGFSSRQYAERERLNEGADGMHFIPEPFLEDRVVDWSPAWSLTADEPRWLPTRFCYFDYRNSEAPGDHLFCMGDSNGCASGGTLEEAILQGLLEVIERDAISIWWYNRLPRPAVLLDGVDQRFLEAMRRHAEAEGRTLELLDLTTDLGIPVMAAVSHDRATGGHIAIGFGAHLDATVAATRALTELNQILYFNATSKPEAQGDAATFDAARDWYETATVAQHSYVLASNTEPSDLRALSRAGVSSIDEAVRHLVEELAGQGHEVIVLNYDRRDVPLNCVRAVVPGLCHFWNRRGAPRLFEAPVRQGVLGKPLAEEDLNPVSFFI